ncbi:OmpA family protein [Moritella sp.]|uniref:OmpA family protein n=1 Tax=Moritella sp. TaxID=78556 RepID=UPI0025CC8CC9|nr:OmpA family protein [Moritella sp.]
MAEPPIAKQSQDQRDFDHDGVINARDKCADTPHSAIVDNDGCPTTVYHDEEQDVLILFSNDSDSIPDAFLPKIQLMADFLELYPDTHIQLKGYASPVGRSEYNIKLSQRRATKVREQLITDGIAPSRIQTIGFGDSDPVWAESEADTLSLSRRVVARVVGSKSSLIKEWTIFKLRHN